jgi:hypothetical protein
VGGWVGYLTHPSIHPARHFTLLDNEKADHCLVGWSVGAGGGASYMGKPVGEHVDEQLDGEDGGEGRVEVLTGARAVHWMKTRNWADAHS